MFHPGALCFMLPLYSSTDANLFSIGQGSNYPMDALEALHYRRSYPRLDGPVPSDKILQNIYKAAIRAADHALLKPWRFLVIQGESRNRLGDLFVEAARTDDAYIDEAKIAKLRSKPLRAPLLLVSISSQQEHLKVPPIEQDLSAAAATQNMLTAAYAQGIGAIWRTGSMAYHPSVEKGLGLRNDEKIIGFIYIGNIRGSEKKLLDTNPNDYFQNW
jgi:nitroreductase